MTEKKDAQSARNAADRRLREANPEQWAALMHEEFQARGLTWSPRASKEEREAREAAEKRAKAAARIAKIAEENGLDVHVEEDGRQVLSHWSSDGGEVTDEEAAVLANEHVSAAIKATFDGTAETVEKDWKDMSDQERKAIAGTRAPRSDAEEAAAWGEPTQYDVSNPDTDDVDYRH